MRRTKEREGGDEDDEVEQLEGEAADAERNVQDEVYQRLRRPLDEGGQRQQDNRQHECRKRKQGPHEHAEVVQRHGVRRWAGKLHKMAALPRGVVAAATREDARRQPRPPLVSTFGTFLKCSRIVQSS